MVVPVPSPQQLPLEFPGFIFHFSRRIGLSPLTVVPPSQASTCGFRGHSPFLFGVSDSPQSQLCDFSRNLALLIFLSNLHTRLPMPPLFFFPSSVYFSLTYFPSVSNQQDSLISLPLSPLLGNLFFLEFLTLSSFCFFFFLFTNLTVRGFKFAAPRPTLFFSFSPLPPPVLWGGGLTCQCPLFSLPPGILLALSFFLSFFLPPFMVLKVPSFQSGPLF